jgi:predicted GTPase
MTTPSDARAVGTEPGDHTEPDPGGPGAVEAGRTGSDQPVAAVVGDLHGPVSAAIATRVDALAEALERAEGLLDPVVVTAVAGAVDRVRERLVLGVDRTVVAIVGGTGSGKSSLFNAVTRLQFAEVGQTRPTTALPSACVWGRDGGALLDWLGVDPHRRIQRESLLDGDEEEALSGLVLVDLPDHDSVEPAHQQVMDQVLPYADLVLWVVDPQKYADDALHSGYLRDLAGHEDETVVVLNQVDTVVPEQRAELVADLARLLVADGLHEVPLLATSAATGEGIAELRARLVEVVAARSSAAAHAATEVSDAAAVLADALGAAVAGPDDADVRAVVETLAGAAGLAAVSDAVSAALRGGGDLPPGFGTVHEDGAELARNQWLTRTTGNLERVWAEEIAARVATAAELRMAVSDALAGIALGVHRSRPARLLVWLGAVLAALGLASAAAAYVAIGAADLPAWVQPTGIGLLVLGVLAIGAGIGLRRSSAARQGRAVARQGRSVIEAVARARLADPTSDVLARQARLRTLVEAARAGQ